MGIGLKNNYRGGHCIFAGLSGDYNQLHTDEEFAKKSYLEHALLMVFWSFLFPLGWCIKREYLRGRRSILGMRV